MSAELNKELIKVMEIKNNTPSFQGYYKITGKPARLDNLKQQIADVTEDYLFINGKENGHKSSFELLTGNHLNKFLDLSKSTILFKNFRKKFSKQIGESPKVLSVAEAEKKLLKGKFDFQ